MSSLCRIPHCFFVVVLLLSVTAPSTLAQVNTRGLTIQKKSPTTDDEPFQAYAERYALVIGIDHYADLGLPDLKYAVSDADAISEVLIDKYHFPAENVTVLRNEEATRSRMLQEMSRYITDRELEEDSQFLFFFAGHGETIRNQIGYILPHDVNLENVAASGIRMNELRDMANAIVPKHALFLMDACYGGLTAFRSNPKSAVMIGNALSSKARQLITAGSADEQVLEAAEYNHSAFTYALLDAIGEGTGDSNGDGIITALELATKIQQDVPFYADVHGGKQTPQYTKLTPDAGDFLFIRDESAVANIKIGETITEGEEKIVEAFKKKLRVVTNVENARIFINDAERDFVTSGEKVLALPVGVYTVAVKKDKYEDVSKEVVISPRDSIVTETFDLESTHSTVHFNIEPADAIVYVDADYVGAGTFIDDIPKGRKRIEVTKEGYESNIRTANITQDSLYYEVRLEPIEATLNLTSLPMDALVISNGVDTLGVTPLKGVTIPYGQHVLTLQKEKYDDYRVSLNITESIELDRTVQLTESAEVVAQRIVTKQRLGLFRGFIGNAILAGGAYVGHSYLNSELDGLPEDDENYQPYQIGSYASLGVSGLFALSAFTRLVKLALVDYDKTLEQEMQRRLQSRTAAAFDAGIGYDGEQLTLAMRLRF